MSEEIENTGDKCFICLESCRNRICIQCKCMAHFKCYGEYLKEYTPYIEYIYDPAMPAMYAVGYPKGVDCPICKVEIPNIKPITRGDTGQARDYIFVRSLNDMVRVLLRVRENRREERDRGDREDENGSGETGESRDSRENDEREEISECDYEENNNDELEMLAIILSYAYNSKHSFHMINDSALGKVLKMYLHKYKDEKDENGNKLWNMSNFYLYQLYNCEKCDDEKERLKANS